MACSRIAGDLKKFLEKYKCLKRGGLFLLSYVSVENRILAPHFPATTHSKPLIAPKRAGPRWSAWLASLRWGHARWVRRKQEEGSPDRRSLSVYRVAGRRKVVERKVEVRGYGGKGGGGTDC